VGRYVKKKKWLIDIRVVLICVIFSILAVMLATLCQQIKYEKQIEEVRADYEDRMAELRADLRESHEAEIAELKQYYEYGGDVTQIEKEAEYISKVVYGYYIAGVLADSDIRAITWCAINRVEHFAHPNTIKEVCEQPKQWMGYSSNNPVLADIYDIVLAELKIWYSDGHRPISNDYIYLTWSSKEILLRDTYEENKNTHYWRMK
jgi:hypothetical protein